MALPLDELGQPLSQSPASQGLDLNQPMLDTPAPDVHSGKVLSPLAAFLTHAALEAGDNQAQAGQDAVQLMTESTPAKGWNLMRSLSAGSRAYSARRIPCRTRRAWKRSAA